MKMIKNIALAIALIANVPTWCTAANNYINLSQNEKFQLDKGLVIAALNGNTAKMRDLLAQGADPDHTLDIVLLRTASLKNNYNIDKVALLACAGADPDKPLNQKDLEKAGELAKRAFAIAIEEREKNPGDCKQCEENCAKRFKELGLYVNKKEATK